jgi:hypothetical protein
MALTGRHRGGVSAPEVNIFVVETALKHDCMLGAAVIVARDGDARVKRDQACAPHARQAEVDGANTWNQSAPCHLRQAPELMEERRR